MTFSLILLIFLTWRAFDNWILYIAEKTIPYLGFFPYPKELYDFGLSQVTSALANFDGIHYLLIAHRGYGQWEQAFFPLYPLLIKYLTPVFNNGLLAGLVISNISFFLGIIFFLKLLKYEILDTKYWILIFLLSFPTSFFFGAVYTEGLFFLLFVSTLYFLKKEKYLLVVLLAVLASLTKLIGVFLVIPITLHFLSLRVPIKSGRSNLKKRSLRRLRLLAMTIISPFIGLGIYCLYLWQSTGDPFFFLTSQPVFGANRSTHLIFLPQVVWRYVKIFITASHNFQFYISLFEFIVFCFVFLVLIFDLFKHLKFNSNFKL